MAANGTLSLHRLDGGVWLVAASGEHDLATADEFAQAFAEVRRGGTRAVVDLSEATFIDSTVIGELVRHSQAEGERLAVVAPSGTMPRRVLDVVRFEQLVPVFETRNRALAALTE
jgi:anti-sigma B factor antagonist